ncbi:ABC transporter substrate-binding protein [Thiofilum flexile]|uniref:ABC transporter substrate-binding protein n=1 Tax=Thiofilum flexile TaxID=125627 RepID=UPI0003627758|nr:ABC transporter substrate-binding protein [Thiofilum flexile]
MSLKRTLIATLLLGTLTTFSTSFAADKTFVYCSEGSPSGFNPQFYTDGTTFDAAGQSIYNRLVEFKPGETSISPALAESWEISADGTVYTFKLRKGVKFQTTKNFTPTRDFNADDVVFSFNRQLQKDHPYHKVSNGAYEYFTAMSMPDLLKSVEKVDDLTVRFTLARPEAPMLANLAMDFASILSAEYADAMMKAGTPEVVDNDPVGTGPFQLVAYQKDAMIRYKAHPDYWEGKPKIDNLVYAITPDNAVRWQKLQAGECHLMPFPNQADLEAMRKNPDMQVLEQEGLNIGYFAYNTQKKPFDDVRVRKALNMAINKPAIVEVVYQGAGKVAKNPIPPTMWGYNDAVQDDPYDVEGAKKLLAEAGVKDLKTNIWAMPVQRPYNPNARRMAEMIQADWKAIGVEAEIVTYEWAEYLERSKKGEHDTLLMGWTGDNGDPDNFLATLLGCDAVKDGSNRAFWCNNEFNDLVVKAKTLSSQDERAKLYQQAQEVFKKEAPWATIAHSVVHEVARKNVTGYKQSPFGLHVFKYVDLAE